MSSGDESLESNEVPSYEYIFGGGLAELEGVSVTPFWSRETSPEVQDTAADKMGDEENLKVHKQTRTAAKSKFTSLKKALINILLNPKIPEGKVNASEKEFQNALKALNEAHSIYVAAKDLLEEDLQDAAYMDTPIADRQEVENKLSFGIY